jgi:hypothetical protein
MHPKTQTRVVSRAWTRACKTAPSRLPSLAAMNHEWIVRSEWSGLLRADPHDERRPGGDAGPFSLGLCHDNVEPASRCILAYAIERRPLVPPFGARNPVIPIDRHLDGHTPGDGALPMCPCHAIKSRATSMAAMNKNQMGSLDM